MNKSQIKNGLIEYLSNKGIKSLKVKCVISGKYMMLNEYEVRYVQYLVKTGQLSNNDVIINGSHPCSDGYLDDNVPEVFRASNVLARELF